MKLHTPLQKRLQKYKLSIHIKSPLREFAKQYKPRFFTPKFLASSTNLIQSILNKYGLANTDLFDEARFTFFRGFEREVPSKEKVNRARSLVITKTKYLRLERTERIFKKLLQKDEKLRFKHVKEYVVRKKAYKLVHELIKESPTLRDEVIKELVTKELKVMPLQAFFNEHTQVLKSYKTLLTTPLQRSSNEKLIQVLQKQEKNITNIALTKIFTAKTPQLQLMKLEELLQTSKQFIKVLEEEKIKEYIKSVQTKLLNHTTPEKKLNSELVLKSLKGRDEFFKAYLEREDIAQSSERVIKEVLRAYPYVKEEVIKEVVEGYLNIKEPLTRRSLEVIAEVVQTNFERSIVKERLIKSYTPLIKEDKGNVKESITLVKELIKKVPLVKSGELTKMLESKVNTFSKEGVSSRQIIEEYKAVSITQRTRIEVAQKLLEKISQKTSLERHEQEVFIKTLLELEPNLKKEELKQVLQRDKVEVIKTYTKRFKEREKTLKEYQEVLIQGLSSVKIENKEQLVESILNINPSISITQLKSFLKPKVLKSSENIIKQYQKYFQIEQKEKIQGVFKHIFGKKSILPQRELHEREYACISELIKHEPLIRRSKIESILEKQEQNFHTLSVTRLKEQVLRESRLGENKTLVRNDEKLAQTLRSFSQTELKRFSKEHKNLVQALIRHNPVVHQSFLKEVLNEQQEKKESSAFISDAYAMLRMQSKTKLQNFRLERVEQVTIKKVKSEVIAKMQEHFPRSTKKEIIELVSALEGSKTNAHHFVQTYSKQSLQRVLEHIVDSDKVKDIIRDFQNTVTQEKLLSFFEKYNVSKLAKSELLTELQETNLKAFSKLYTHTKEVKKEISVLLAQVFHKHEPLSSARGVQERMQNFEQRFVNLHFNAKESYQTLVQKLKTEDVNFFKELLTQEVLEKSLQERYSAPKYMQRTKKRAKHLAKKLLENEQNQTRNLEEKSFLFIQDLLGHAPLMKQEKVLMLAQNQLRKELVKKQTHKKSSLPHFDDIKQELLSSKQIKKEFIKSVEQNAQTQFEKTAMTALPQVVPTMQAASSVKKVLSLNLQKHKKLFASKESTDELVLEEKNLSFLEASRQKKKQATQLQEKVNSLVSEELQTKVVQKQMDHSKQVLESLEHKIDELALRIFNDIKDEIEIEFKRL